VTVFMDTSAVLALLHDGDRHHQRAARTWTWMLERGKQVVSHNYVVVESNALLARRFGMGGVHALRDLVDLISIHWVTAELHRVATAAQLAARRRKLSLVDCTSFEVMRHLGIRHAFAFDRHFQVAGFTYPTP